MDSTLGKLYKTLSKIRHLNIVGSLDLMPPAEMEVLGEIKSLSKDEDGRSVNVSDISQALNISTPAVSRTLKRLEDKALIERKVDEKDRRNICVSITGKGQEVLRENVAVLLEFLEKTFNSLGREKTEILSEILDTLHQSLCRELDLINKDKEQDTK